VKGGERGVAKKVLAVGKEAKLMLGRTPGNILCAIRPLKEGVIADFEITEAMLRYFIRRCTNEAGLSGPESSSECPAALPRWRKGPCGKSAESAGAREVYFIEEPMAAAIDRDARYRAQGKYGCRHRGGTTEVAVFSLGGIVYSKSVRVAGDRMDEALWITSGEISSPHRFQHSGNH